MNYFAGRRLSWSFTPSSRPVRAILQDSRSRAMPRQGARFTWKRSIKSSRRSNQLSKTEEIDCCAMLAEVTRKREIPSPLCDSNFLAQREPNRARLCRPRLDRSIDVVTSRPTKISINRQPVMHSKCRFHLLATCRGLGGVSKSRDDGAAVYIQRRAVVRILMRSSSRDRSCEIWR